MGPGAQRAGDARSTGRAGGEGRLGRAEGRRGADLCGLGQRRWWAGVERGKQRIGLGPGRGLGWWASGMGFGSGWVWDLLGFLLFFISIYSLFSISNSNKV